MSWKPEFLIDGKWYDNAVRFATEAEAKQNAQDKFMVWTMPSDYRATETPGAEPTHEYTDHGTQRIGERRE